MSAVFIVMQGEYSDKSISSVWSSEELAKKAVDALNQEDYPDYPRYYKYEVDQVSLLLLDGKNLYRVWMGENGDVYSAGLCHDDKKPSFESDGDGYCTCICRATNKEHAIKICNDKRAQYLATKPIGGAL